MSGFYRLDNILSKDPKYCILLGERANGKSYAVKERALREALTARGLTSVLIRRYEEDIKASLIRSYFDDMPIKKMSKGDYDGVAFYQGSFYFTRANEKGKQERDFEFCRVLALSVDERYKSSLVVPMVTTIIFEEFTTQKLYLTNEVSRFMNLCSTILRLRPGKVFMIANKVSRVCPYFNEWVLRGIPTMVDGQIDEYIYKDVQDAEVKICVEMCASPDHKKSGMFFGSTGKQIDGGAWQCEEHPHLVGDVADYERLYEMSLQHMDFKFNILLLMHRKEDYLCVYVYPATLRTYDRVLSEEYSTDVNVTPCLHRINRAECMVAQLRKDNKFVYPTNLIAEDFETVVKNMAHDPFCLV